MSSLQLYTGSGLLLLLVLFVTLFLLPGLALRFRLGRRLKALRDEKTRSAGDLQKIFQGDKKLAHLWKEFSDTLHEQKGGRDGQAVVIARRATVAAESFFSAQYLVDNRLRTEFF